MLNKSIALLATSALMLGTVHLAQANTVASPSTFTHGPYAGIGVGSQFPAVGGVAVLGYQFNPRFAAEGSVSVDPFTTSFQLDAKMLFPVRKNISLYAKGGLNVDAIRFPLFGTGTVLSPNIGVGATIHFNKYLGTDIGTSYIFRNFDNSGDGGSANSVLAQATLNYYF